MADQYLDVNLNELRVREIEEIEEIIGTNIDQAFGNGAPRGKAMRALGYVMKKREDPAFTLEDAGELIVRLQEPDPTTAAE